MRTAAQPYESTIVVVEDEEDLLDITCEVLREEGFDLVGFRQARDALDYVAHQRPALLITDLRLPSMTGEEFIAQVRQHAGAVFPIAVMSAAADLPEQVRAGHLDVQDYLKKPFDLDDLCALARRFASPARASA